MVQLCDVSASTSSHEEMSMVRLDEHVEAVGEMLRYLVDFPFTILVRPPFVDALVTLLQSHLFFQKDTSHGELGIWAVL